jgi:hypothetical protein
MRGSVKHGAKLGYAGALVLGVMVGCGSSDSSTAEGNRGTDGDVPGTGAGQPGGQESDPGPEVEAEPAFQVPIVSGRWVWTANPSSGAVAVIDAQSLVVHTARAGEGPTQLAALPPPRGGGSRALVLNGLSSDATLLTAGDDGVVVADTTLPLHRGANAWATTSDGRFAIAWTNVAAVQNPDPSEGFQDITVLSLAEGARSSKRLSVGFRPVRVFLDDDDRYAYFATDAGIAVVDLLASNGPEVVREVAVSAEPARDSDPREVNVTPDGSFAFVSRRGRSHVTVVDLGAGSFADVQLPGVVTDLDLSADAELAVVIVQRPAVATQELPAAGGSGGEGGDAGAGGEGGDASGGAAGSMTGRGSAIVLLPVREILDAPTTFRTIESDESFGSVELGENGRALLFQNGSPSSRLTLLDLGAAASEPSRTLDLKLPVFSAAATPDGEHALVLLKPPAGSAKPGAFAVVPLSGDLPAAINGTVAATVPPDLAVGAPAMVALDDGHALVTVSDGSQVHVAYLVGMPSLLVDPIALGSAPLRGGSGIVPEANRAFVAQQHPEGRITFIELDSGAHRTLTGFELSSRVRK